MPTTGVQRRQDNLVRRAFRLMGERVRSQFAKVNEWRRGASEGVRGLFSGITDWMLECKWGIIITLAVLVWVVLMIWFIADASSGRVKGSAVQVGVGGIVGGAIVGLIASPIAGGVVFLVLLLLNWLLRFLVSVLIYLPLLFWTPIYAGWSSVLVVVHLLVLLPLSALFVVTRVIQLWRRIFHTCPVRECSYRGLPAYECPDCSTPNEHLWPNIYGVFSHECVTCGRKLSTLYHGNLKRHCGKCHILLEGKHAGKVPERLVAIVGGPNSGKTTYLHMTVDDIVDGKGPVRGTIDVEELDVQFKQEKQRMARGLMLGKTSAVLKAFLLYVRVNGSRCQLYLYDAPGEEFTSARGMTRQQYFHLLTGFILMVDPYSFAESEEVRKEATPLQDVIDSTLMWAISDAGGSARGKIPMRVAVVIGKADLDGLREWIGDVTKESISPSKCREALVTWGAGNAIQGLENRFESVDYFACSALGRDPGGGARQPFEGHGLIEPLAWVLTGKRSTNGK